MFIYVCHITSDAHFVCSFTKVNMLKIVVLSFDDAIVCELFLFPIYFRARYINYFSCVLQMECGTNFYKVVETIEKGIPVLSIVSSLWENNGKLWWPASDKASEKALQRNPSIPRGTVEGGWTEHDCVLKRSFIPTYALARKEMCLMSDESETTDAEAMNILKQTPMMTTQRSAGARKIMKPPNNNPDASRKNHNQVYIAI